MGWLAPLGGVFLLAALIALLYWQLIIAEGVYLGRRIVIWLYDLYASRYDRIKKFDARDDDWFLGEPLASALSNTPFPLVLDVATGTGRLPLALFRQPNFSGRVVALDLSRRMLHRAAANTAAQRDRLTLLWQDASRLPFPAAVFDAVTCLEALEFLPDARLALSEMVRVLRPGGVLLTTNRIGPGVRWLPRRTMSRQGCAALLESLSLESVSIRAWQVDYDVVWARKGGQSTAAVPPTLPALLRCPHCDGGLLSRREHAFYCPVCTRRYPIAQDGVMEMGW
jgi:SAM-dependent methyltransferase